jgi:hypothetical protein
VNSTGWPSPEAFCPSPIGKLALPCKKRTNQRNICQWSIFIITAITGTYWKGAEIDHPDHVLKEDAHASTQTGAAVNSMIGITLANLADRHSTFMINNDPQAIPYICRRQKDRFRAIFRSPKQYVNDPPLFDPIRSILLKEPRCGPSPEVRFNVD